jgi:hypothetical protein
MYFFHTYGTPTLQFPVKYSAILCGCKSKMRVARTLMFPMIRILIEFVDVTHFKK